MRRLIAAAAALALTATTGGCAIAPGDGTYRLTVHFAKTTSLYERSRVKIMGADAGNVVSITPEENGVRVELELDGSVPVRRDTRAAIASANALGERFVVLHPPWQPGAPKAPSGMVVPRERTKLPVEIDDALAAFARLNESIDPKQLGDAVGRGADDLRGRGGDVNDALRGTADLTENLAAQDERIVSLADGLRTLATELNARDKRLGELIDSFSSVSRTLTEERARLTAFIEGLAAAIRESRVIVTAYKETLPSTVSDLSNIVLTLKSNAGSLNQAIDALGTFADVAVDAWDRQNHVATIRVVVHGTLRAWLQPLFDAMGWGTVPCLQGEPALANCTEGPR
ncbi:MCE family protein [Actinomadura sp. LOL_016]|uniref:MCE family protein n=1 Tax=unclassified Actinomadura TaxID=2626254 RepID=UPI003A80036E